MVSERAVDIPTFFSSESIGEYNKLGIETVMTVNIYAVPQPQGRLAAMDIQQIPQHLLPKSGQLKGNLEDLEQYENENEIPESWPEP
jgi:hypothetical protein